MVKIEGREQLRRKFAAMPQTVRAELAKAVPSAAADLVAMQKRLVPKRTGALADSIRAEPVPGEEFAELVIAGGTLATRRELRAGSGIYGDEALFEEFGTKKHRNAGKFAGSMNPGAPARPFFFVAYRALKRSIRAKIARAMSKGIRTGAGGA